MPQASAALLGLLITARAHAPAAPPRAQTLTPQQIFKKYSSCVVKIETKKGSGTGFLDPIGWVYTAYHVVDGASEARITLSNGRQLTGSKVLAADPEKDIAIIITDASVSLQRPNFGDYAALEVGEPVTVNGNPLGLSYSLTAGIVSSKRADRGAHYLQLSAAVSPGSSGSPVFNSKGEIVGMVVAALKEGQQLNFAISSRDLKPAWGVPMSRACASPARLTGTAKSREDFRKSWDLRSHHAQLYEDLHQVSVLIESLPEELTDVVSPEEIRSWVEGSLGEADLKIVSDEQQNREFMESERPSNELGELGRQDRFRSGLYVSLNAGRNLAGTTIVSCGAYVQRAGIVFPGGVDTVTVDYNTAICSFGDLEKKAFLKGLVQFTMKPIIERWKYANSKQQNP